MRLYDDLRNRIRCVARDGKEFNRFCDLVTQHFEGKHVFNDMPDVLKLAVSEWENEQQGKES